MKWKERMGLALSGALIGLTLLLIVDVHYRMNNGEFTNVSGGNAAFEGLPPGSGQVGSAQVGGGNVPGAIGGDTAENQYANSKLSAAKVAMGQQRDSTILMKHDKVQFAHPSNISQIVNK
jgi:hypothetical protein